MGNQLASQKATKAQKVECEEIFNRLIALHPEDSKPESRTKDIQKELGNYEELLVCSNEMGDGPDGEKLENIRNSLRQKYEGVIQCCNQSIEQKPDFLAPYYIKAVILQSMKIPERDLEALAVWDQLLKIDEQDVEVYRNKGKIYVRQEEFSRALLNFEKATRIEPTFKETILEKAKLCEKLKRWERVIGSYDQLLALSKEGENVNLYRSKGKALKEVKSWPEVVECFDRVITQVPNNVEDYLSKAEGLYELERYQELLECFKKAEEIDPIKGNKDEIKRLVFWRLKKWSEVIECCDRLISRNPQNEDGKSDDYYFCKGRSYEMLGNYYRAIESYSKIFGNELKLASVGKKEEKSVQAPSEALENGIPNNANGCFFEGLILYSLGKYEVASICFSNAIHFLSDFVDAYRMRGLCLEKLGKNEAEENFEIAKLLNPETEKSEPKLVLDLENLTEDLKVIQNMDSSQLIQHLQELRNGEADSLF